MSTYQSVLEQALELTDEERELLVVSVSATLVPDRPSHEEFWAAEIARRLRAIDDGSEPLLSEDEVDTVLADDL